jgi:hypothetical protein
MICTKTQVLRISEGDEIIKSVFTLFSFLNFIVLPPLIFIALSNLETTPKIHLCGVFQQNHLQWYGCHRFVRKN